MGGREVSRPYRVWFFAEGERFLSIWRCHRPHWGGRRWCCGVADSSICLKSDCHSTNDRCEALASLKGCFFMFLFQSPSIFPLNRFIRLHGVNHNQPFPTANQELIWSVSSFFLWLLMVKMSDF